ncbi:MAG: amino acid racemase [Defluviitaleaceae bacterium]|nr:amino acid racemase [Defluviitaleaceae bacterium]
MSAPSNKGTLGVIGGMGPLATATFFELLVQHTQAATDQEHLDIIIYNMPRIPDRTGFILGRNEESPGPLLSEYARKLQAEGVAAIAVPCVTATYFYDEIIKSTGANVINTIDEIAVHIVNRNAKKIGLMATDGTITTRIFQKYMVKYGIECVTPDEAHQKLVMKVIFEGVKAGRDVNMSEFHSVAAHLKDCGCDAIILGCTELSVVNKQHGLDPNVFVDALVVLAGASILRCGGKVKF